MFVVYPVGKKASQFARKLVGKGVEIAVVDYMTAKSSGEEIARFTSELTRDFLAGKIDEIEVVYTITRVPVNNCWLRASYCLSRPAIWLPARRSSAISPTCSSPM